MLQVDPNRIRTGYPIRISATDSHERTDGRTVGEANYVSPSWYVLQRVRAYRGLAAVGRFERLADAAAEAKTP